MNTVLIVDDEPNIVNVLKEYCQYNSLIVDTAYNGREAVEKAEQYDYDCIIIDIMMPELNGFDAIKQIKKTKNIPVIIMSAKSEEYDKLKGFELGVDDYIVKPFSPKEVIARVKALLKRTSSFVEYAKLDDLKIDLNSKKVFVLEQEVTLTHKEYELLVFMIKNKGIVLSRDKMLNEIWGWDYEKDVRTVDTHIKMLRQDLKEASRYIKTVRGSGYKFEND